MTVVTEGIYSLLRPEGEDRHRPSSGGRACAIVRVEGEPVGHVTTGEYGSQMLSLGGVQSSDRRLQDARAASPARRDARRSPTANPSELTIDGGASADRRKRGKPAASSTASARASVCGSAAARRPSGFSRKQWFGKVDDVVVVDDHITGVLSEHQAGKLIGATRLRHSPERAGARRRAVISAWPTPARVGAAPTCPTRWTILDAASTPRSLDPAMTLLMVSTTGEHARLLPARRDADGPREASTARRSRPSRSRA